jgi:Cyclic nucleotide-binding domain
MSSAAIPATSAGTGTSGSGTTSIEFANLVQVQFPAAIPSDIPAATAMTRMVVVCQPTTARSKPRITTLNAGDTLVRQGETGSELFLVLDGVIRVDRDGSQLAEYGPGALLGDRAHLEGGVRTSTLVAATACWVAAVPASQSGTDALVELSAGHRREDAAAGG